MPRKTTAAVVDRIESELDRLDPAPVTVPPPRPPRARRPPIGPEEKGVRFSLRNLPDDLRKGGIAAGLITLAQDLDRGMVVGRDRAAHIREIRQGITTLIELSPGERKGDATDELQQRRENRLGGTG